MIKWYEHFLNLGWLGTTTQVPENKFMTLVYVKYSDQTLISY